jgi:hypothetical protein
MTHRFHAVIWLDHKQAKIFEIGKTGQSFVHVNASDAAGNLHHKAGTPGAGHARPDLAYFEAVADAASPAREILIVGKGTAKAELANFIKDRLPALAARVVGVVGLDKETEPEVLAFAQKFFDRMDRTTPQR